MYNTTKAQFLIANSPNSDELLKMRRILHIDALIREIKTTGSACRYFYKLGLSISAVMLKLELGDKCAVSYLGLAA